MRYLEGMGNLDGLDPFISTEEAIEVDTEMAEAIQLGIEDAEAGRVFTMDEVRESMQQWLSMRSTHQRVSRSAREG